MLHAARSFFTDQDIELEQEEFRARKSASIVLWALGAFVVLFLLLAHRPPADECR